MFKRGVKTVTDDFLRQIQENGLNSLIDISDRMEHSTGLFYICDNCHLYLKKNELPPLNIHNGMDLDEIPDDSEIEKHTPKAEIFKLEQSKKIEKDDEDDMIPKVEELE